MKNPKVSPKSARYSIELQMYKGEPFGAELFDRVKNRVVKSVGLHDIGLLGLYDITLAQQRYIDEIQGKYLIGGRKNPKLTVPEKHQPKKKFPLLGLGLIAGIGYLIWRASKQA